MKYVKWAGAILAAVIFAFVAVGFLLPSEVRLERSAVVEPPPCTVYAYLEGFQRFSEFSPWQKKDEKAVYVYSGPTFGPGASMVWTSDVVGNGSQEITAVKACERVDIALNFGPDGAAAAYWTLAPEGAGTKVTWGFTSDAGYNLIGRYFGLIMDSLLGPDYEQGIADFKKMVDAGPKADLAGFDAETIDAPAQPFVFLAVDSAKDPASVGAAVGPAFGQVAAWLPANGLTLAGAPVVRTLSVEGDTFKMEAGFPTSDRPLSVPEPFQVGVLGGGPAVKVVHVGGYGGLEATHAKLDAWMEVRRLVPEGPRWESFPDDPATVAEKELRTEIYAPLKTVSK